LTGDVTKPGETVVVWRDEGHEVKKLMGDEINKERLTRETVGDENKGKGWR